MNKRLLDNLQGREENYILPFLWLHGTDEQNIRNCMAKIHQSGIRAVCVEARPHPDYVGPQWWHDLDIVMDEARKRRMRVWVLDDAHFPTGFANGAGKNAPDSMKRWALIERRILTDGPICDAKFNVAGYLGHAFLDHTVSPEIKKEELVGVIAGRREEENGSVFYTELTDLTDQVTSDGWLYHNFDEGNYCLFIYTKRQGTAAAQNDYLCLIDREAVRLFIDRVYEPHYERYHDDFGKTFAGFFSDEPGFYNCADDPFAVRQIGENMPLPWTNELARAYFDETAGGGRKMLPALFHACGGEERNCRYHYMNRLTRLYEQNFSLQIGDWCEAHGVEYIGHVLENGMAHSCLGPGTGHYFRAMRGQHMSGIDIVYNDLLPEYDYDRGTFYHYELAALGASAAHQNNRMKGRALCEIFGAYGWSEGLTLMKWMADHMLVNGINWFTPHAFTDKAFPDPDCPPHFYAQGNNPQFRYMPILNHYMNRICHLFNGGKTDPQVAVLFPAEGGWMGKHEKFGRIGRLCLQHQIQYDVLCMDALRSARIAKGKIFIGSVGYRYLFVDDVEALSAADAQTLNRCYEQGAQVYCVDRRPISPEGIACSSAPVIDLENVLPLLDGCRLCIPDTAEKWLRCYGYYFPDLRVWMLANSSMNHRIHTAATIPDLRHAVVYNALSNTLEALAQEGERMELSLDYGETLLLLQGEGLEKWTRQKLHLAPNFRPVTEEFRISLADYRTPDQFVYLRTVRELTNVARMRKKFAGTICYETTFTGEADMLDLGRCYEAVAVYVNDRPAGVCIGYPYRYTLTGLTVKGENRLRIEAATTLSEPIVEPVSIERAVPPPGMFGPVRLFNRINDQQETVGV